MKYKIDIVCDDLKYLPTYANDSDLCMDVKVIAPKNGYVLTPNSINMFRTGFKVKVPYGWGLEIVPRSSTGIKMRCRLANSKGVIDAGYRDEVKIVLHNFGTQTQIIEDGQRICQLKLVEKHEIEWNIVPDDESFREGNRGGGIQSTGKF